MAMIRYATREITAKLVYYGPGLSGKTTNLVQVNRMKPGGRVGDMISLATEGDRTIYFDLLPLNVGTIAGFRVRFQLFTVPGQTHYNKTRKEVLREADGVVFVADSQPARREANVESFANLRTNLGEVGLDFATIPMVLQLNKRDLADALPVETMVADLGARPLEHFEAVAVKGDGVVETLSGATRAVLEALDKRYNVYDRGTAASASAPEPKEAVLVGEPVPAAAAAAPRRAAAEPRPRPAPSAPARPALPVPPRRRSAVAVPRADAASVAEVKRLIEEERGQRQRDKRELLEAIADLRRLVESRLR